MAASTDSLRRPRLSVAMIVRDEAEVLAASIDSVRPIADEIVVLDTGSSDETPRIAEQLKAVVGRAAWNEDFSAARNRCLELVAGDWVLWLDAGERLQADSAAELRTFVDQQANPQTAYMLMVEVPPADPSASAEQSAQLRLMPNRPELRFAGRVRETLRPAIEPAGLSIDMAPGRVLRHARQHDPQRRACRAQRNLNLITLEAAEEQKYSSRLLLALGEAYSDLGDQEGARYAFFQAIAKSSRGSTEMLEAYYGLLTTFDDAGQQALRLSTCLDALEVFPLDAQLLLAMGNYLQANNRIDLAARSFEAAVRFGQVDLETWHLRELAEVSAGCLSLVRQLQGQEDEARRVLEEALGRHAESIRLKRHLLALLVKQRQSDEAQRIADQLPIEPEQRGPLRNAIRGACCAAGGDWTPALGYLQSAYVEGCRDPFCLRWLAVTLLSNGQTEAAEPVLRDWQQLEPGNVELRIYLAALGQKPPEQSGAQATETLAEADSHGRRLRVDPRTTVLAMPPLIPIVTQVSSAHPTAG